MAASVPPSQLLLEQLVTAFALCPGRRTLTRLWSVIPADLRRHYGAYAGWVREGYGSMDELGGGWSSTSFSAGCLAHC